MDRRIAAFVLAAAFLAVAIPMPASGPFLRLSIVRLALFTALAAAGLAILMIRGVRWEMARTPLLAAALLGIGYVLGAGRSPAPATSLLGLAHKGSVLAIAMIVAVLASQEEGRRTLSRMATLFLAVLALTALIAGAIRGKIPLVGSLGHANVLAYLIVVLVPLVEFSARKAQTRWEKWIAWGSVGLALLVVVLTLSAGAFLALAVGWGPTFLFSQDNRKRLATVLAAGAVAVAAISMGLLVKGREVAVTPRVQLIHAGVRAFAQAPVTGQGVYSFLYRFPELRTVDMQYFPDTCAQKPVDHVHFEPLHTAVESGAIGAAGLILLAGWLLLSAGRAARDRGLWGRTIWRMTAAAMVQGVVSLAPAREGSLAVAIVLGVVLAIPLKASRPLPRSLPALLALALLASLPLQWKRISSDFALRQGRDPNLYYGARNVDALRKAALLWPEDVEAPTLLTVTLYQRAMLPDTDPQVKVKLLDEALGWSRHVQRLSPQFFKEPILAARILLALGDPAGALEELNRGDRFVTNREWLELRVVVINSLKNSQ
ncbi:MAG: O-antigen ligase family protein [bacterium]